MKVLPWVVGFVVGVVVAQAFLPRFQLITTNYGTTGFVLRVDHNGAERDTYEACARESPDHAPSQRSPSYALRPLAHPESVGYPVARS